MAILLNRHTTASFPAGHILSQLLSKNSQFGVAEFVFHWVYTLSKFTHFSLSPSGQAHNLIAFRCGTSCLDPSSVEQASASQDDWMF